LCKHKLADHHLLSKGNAHSIDGFLGYLRPRQRRPDNSLPGLVFPVWRPKDNDHVECFDGHI
jgi:hypothetical protein